LKTRLKNFIEAYYHFFDQRLPNTTLIIGIVWFLVLCVWMLIGGEYQVQAHMSKANILEIKPNQLMHIWWETYQIEFKKIEE